MSITGKRFAEGIHKLVEEAVPGASDEDILVMLVGAAYSYASKLGLSRMAFFARVHELLGRLQDKADA